MHIAAELQFSCQQHTLPIDCGTRCGTSYNSSNKVSRTIIPEDLKTLHLRRSRQLSCRLLLTGQSAVCRFAQTYHQADISAP